MKICGRCKVEKALADFNKHAGRKDGFCENCRECTKIIKKIHYEKYKTKLQKKFRDAYAANKDKILERNKKYRDANKEKIEKQRKLYVKNNFAKVAKTKKRYYEDNKERQAIWAKEWREKNKKYNSQRKAKYQKNRLYSDSLFKLSMTLRMRVRNAIKRQNGIKSEFTIELLGGSVAFVRKWIESQFLPGMTWENHGEWHIDHIKPCAAFDLTDPEQQRECFNYTNLQPLWAVDNLRKGDRL